MTKDLLRIGLKLRGSMWPEVVRVEKVGQLGNRINLGVVGVNSGKYYAKLIREDELKEIEPLAATGTGDARSVFLALEGLRIKLAHTFDPHFAVSVSQIDPLPHQLEAVYHYLLQSPQLRFLLADDPGAGKTIMAGLLLKELKFRGVVERTLIICPASLTPQWMREMKEKFGETFEIVDRNTMQSNWGKNIWEDKHQAITSVYWARKDEIRETLASVDWDVVIVERLTRWQPTDMDVSGKKPTPTSSVNS